MEDKLPQILLLGDPRLRTVSRAVADFADHRLKEEIETLHAVLDRSRARHGFGRAISAPQIGIAKRMIALNLDGQRTIVINPQITWFSPDRFCLWDDCFSFPDLLVKVERHSSISVKFQDELGRDCLWQNLDQGRAELMQHEIDHLDGVLAIDRAINLQSIIYRSSLRHPLTREVAVDATST